MADLNAKQRFQLAGQLFQAKRYPDAFQLLDTLMGEFPGNTDIMHAHAMCLAAMGRRDEAIAACETLSTIYGDVRGEQLKARLLAAPRAGAQQAKPGARASAKAKPAAKPAAKKRGVLPLVAVIVVLAVAGGGAYYYMSMMETGGTGKTRVAGNAAPARPAGGVYGDPNGLRLTVKNNLGGVLDLWVGQIDAGSVPTVTLQDGETAEVGVTAASAMMRATGTWSSIRFNTGPQEIHAVTAKNWTFTREVNILGVPEVKWTLE